LTPSSSRIITSHTLLTVSDEANVEQELTPTFENFRQQLANVSSGGDTVVYDALDAARRMFMDYRSDLPQLRKRIIIVTDGEDTGSKASARDVCHALQKNSIIVDSVQVGNRSDKKLHAISVATGARCSQFQGFSRSDS
jgi:Mg-chelatase subunit ChlD